MARECIANRYLIDSSSGVSIALSIIHRGMIDRRLHDESPTHLVSATESITHLRDGDNPFVAKDKRKAPDIPPVHQLMIWPLLDQFDEGSADSRSLDTRQQLMSAGFGDRDVLYRKVLEPDTAEDKRPHLPGYCGLCTC
jgi:hypothetical protein